MNIIAKSAARHDPLYGKSQICPNIEIQLLDEYNNHNNCTRELFDIIKSVPTANILAVHTPITKKSALNIENIENPDVYFKLMQTVSLANMVGDYEDKQIKVICHTAFCFDTYKMFPSTLSRIELVTHKILSEYPRVILCIENVIPCNIHEGNEIVFRNGCVRDSVYLVRHLQQLFNETERIKTVLDTCHLVTSTKILNMIFKEIYPDLIADKTDDLIFKDNQDVVGLIHLSDVKNLGYNPGEHGVKFDDDRLSEMNRLMDLYYKYNYNCDITIEIPEDDYVINNNFRKNYKDLKSIINAHNNITE